MTNVSHAHKKISLSEFITAKLEQYFHELNGNKPATSLYDQIIQEVEKPLLITTLAFCKGNQVKAAQLLGINRNTLRKKLKGMEEEGMSMPETSD